MTNTSRKAVGLLSGGLDSTLAAKMLLEQGIEVHAINFTSPFCTCTAKGASCAAVITAVRQLGDIPLRRTRLGDEYLAMVRNPRYGYGRGMNPCIDCRIMKIRKAAEYMEAIDGSFLFTGEVLGQRPMSQHKQAMEIIDKGSGVEGLILRPLSAAQLKPTLPEREGWVDREKLLGFSGKTRRPQIALADRMGITDYPCPGGGCRLTDKNFAEKLREYFAHTNEPCLADMPLLRFGRHVRLDNGAKLVLARNESEGQTLKRLARADDHLYLPTFSGPIALLRGERSDEVLPWILKFTKKLPAGEAECLRVHDNASIVEKAESGVRVR